MERRGCIGFVTLAACLCGGHTLEGRAQEESPKGTPAPALPEASAPAELATLELFLGPWRVVEQHFNARGDVVATVKGTEEVTFILDRRAIRRVYTTTTEARVFRAEGTLTWNAVEKVFHGMWFDNTSTTGPSTVKGEWTPESRTMDFTVDSRAKDGSAVHYKVIERFLDVKRRVATTFLIKGTEVQKRMEVMYERMIPCPDHIRVIISEDVLGINK